MKIFICCSKYLYGKIPEIKEKLELLGHDITLPNSYENPLKEEEYKKLGEKEHAAWKSSMLKLQENKIKQNEAVLILNFDKNEHKNYIGGATFLEMFKAWELRKKLYLFNPISESILKDEILGFSPIVLNGNLELIK